MGVDLWQSPAQGSVSCLDMCAFVGDVGEMLSAADFMAILREVRLLWSWDDHASYALLVKDRDMSKDVLDTREACVPPHESLERLYRVLAGWRWVSGLHRSSRDVGSTGCV